MSPDDVFKAIIEDPESDQLRLDYANACAPADPDRANYIRLQLEDRNLMRSGKESTSAAMAARGLVSRLDNEKRWAGPIADRVDWYDFGRGFVEDIKIAATPESNQLRLDYANDCASVDPERSEFIRLQIQTRELMRSGDKWTSVYGDAHAFLDKPGQKHRWAGRIADQVRWCDFGCGFVEDIEIDAADFLRRGEELYRLAPIRRLYLKNTAPAAESLFRSPLLDRIVSLVIDPQQLSDHHISLLAESPYVSKLGYLSLAGNEVTTAGLEELMRSGRLPSLKYVKFYSCPVYESDLGEEYADELGHVTYLKEGLWPIEERLGRKTWLHTVSDHGLGYTLPSAY